MPSLIPGYEYDIFISYRQKDNKYDGWITEFVANLKKELEATFKEDISIYFDENPHDGIQEIHQVNETLRSKIKCLIFIPILSRTYCDPNCFAWKFEFLVFNQIASKDSIGMQVTLKNGNVVNRVLPIRIHDLEREDLQLVEDELGMQLRAVDFVFKTPGVNRPLSAKEVHPNDNLEQTYYRDQINKVANFISDIIGSLKRKQSTPVQTSSIRKQEDIKPTPESQWNSKKIYQKIIKRNILRAALAYILFSVVLIQVGWIAKQFFNLPEQLPTLLTGIVLVLFPVALVLAWYYEFSPEGIIRTGSGKSRINPYQDSRRKPLTGNLFLFALIIVMVLQYAYLVNLDAVGVTDIDLSGEKSIVVLPFENRGEAVNEYFTAGLTEDINAQLSKVNELRVIAAAAVRSYKGRQDSYINLANDLGVSYVLTGSIQYAGNQLRIAPQLIDGRTNKYLWGEVFNVEMKDLFNVQNEIAQRIAAILKIKLTDVEMIKMSKKPTENFSAYDYYLKGRSHYYQYKPEENDLAIEQFKQAIAADPGFAVAWAGLGDAFNQRGGRFARGTQWIDSALHASKRAIQLDSNLSEGYKSLASAYYYLTKYDTSRILMEAAVKLDPNNVAAVGNLGTSYFLDNDLVQSLRWQKKSAGLNPKNFIPFQIAGWTYRLMGDYEKAETWLKKSLELKPEYDTYELLAYVYVSQGRKQEALKLIPDLLKLDQQDPFVLETAGLIANFAGNSVEARKYFKRNQDDNEIVSRDPEFVGNIHLAQLYLQEDKNMVDAEVLLVNAFEQNISAINKGSLDRGFPMNIAGIYAIQGKHDQAIHWIDKAIEVNWIDYMMLTHGPWFVSMRNDRELLKRVDLLKKKMEELRKKAASL